MIRNGVGDFFQTKNAFLLFDITFLFFGRKWAGKSSTGCLLAWRFSGLVFFLSFFFNLFCRCCLFPLHTITKIVYSISHIRKGKVKRKKGDH